MVSYRSAVGFDVSCGLPDARLDERAQGAQLRSKPPEERGGLLPTYV
jgi:hypothetical protein